MVSMSMRLTRFGLKAWSVNSRERKGKCSLTVNDQGDVMLVMEFPSYKPDQALEKAVNHVLNSKADKSKEYLWGRYWFMMARRGE